MNLAKLFGMIRAYIGGAALGDVVVLKLDALSRVPAAVAKRLEPLRGHVLAGLDTSLAGEAGVLAFDVGQGAAPVGRGALSLVRLLYSAVAPWQAGAIARNVRAGLSMGGAADLVMAAPIESYFDEPLESVRKNLGIDGARAAAVSSSR